MNKIIRAVLVLALLSFISGLFGCKGKTPRHSAKDIRGVSVSCGHMNRSFGYSFWVRTDSKSVLFDADCFTQNKEIPTVLEAVEISESEFDELMKIIEEKQLIKYAENYKKPPKSPFMVLDDTTYAFNLTFTDGENILTNDRQEELENFFCALAEKYAETHNIADTENLDEKEE